MTGRKGKVRLTDVGVRKMRPGKAEYMQWDSRVSGLGVRIRPSGHRSFVWHGRLNGVFVRMAIGPAALKTVEEARRECQALQAGTHPRSTEGRADRRAVPAFRDFVADEWLPARRGRYSPSWRKRVGHMIRRQLLPAFGARRLNRIGRRDVERWFEAYSRTSPGAANKALILFRQIMNAAVAVGHVEGSPSQGVRLNRGRRLTRFLSTEEIGRLQRALDRLVEERPSRRPQADIIRLLLLTGCRKSEISMLKWSEIDGDVLRLRKAKTGPRTVWLSNAAQTIIARQPRTAPTWVFPSPKDPARPLSDNLRLWYRARRMAKVDDVRLHDLRHTVASQAVARGVPLPTVAKMLGHSQPAMTLRYAHVGDPELEAAAERIGMIIVTAMTE